MFRAHERHKVLVGVFAASLTLAMAAAVATGEAGQLNETGPASWPSPVRADDPGRGKGIALRHGHHAWGENPGALSSDLGDVERLGVDWIRVLLDYSPSPDPEFDRLVDEAAARGFNLLVTLGKPEPLNDLGTTEDRALYRRWVTTSVARYREVVRHWEVLNEPNLHMEWAIDEATRDDAAYRRAVLRYVTLLQDAHDAIRAADPAAVIHMGGISEWTMERFFAVVMETDAARFIDVIGFHPYGRDPGAVVDRYRALVGVLTRDPAYAAKPVWITEVGFNTTWPWLLGFVASEEDKANRLVAAIGGLRAAGVRFPIFWYTLHENDREPGFGVLVKDPTTLATTYLPAFAAYRDLDRGTGVP